MVIRQLGLPKYLRSTSWSLSRVGRGAERSRIHTLWRHVRQSSSYESGNDPAKAPTPYRVLEGVGVCWETRKAEREVGVCAYEPIARKEIESIMEEKVLGEMLALGRKTEWDAVGTDSEKEQQDFVVEEIAQEQGEVAGGMEKESGRERNFVEEVKREERNWEGQIEGEFVSEETKPEERNLEGEIKEELMNKEVMPEERDSEGETVKGHVSKEAMPEERGPEGEIEEELVNKEVMPEERDSEGEIVKDLASTKAMPEEREIEEELVTKEAIPEERDPEGEVEEELVNKEIMPEEADSEGEVEKDLVRKEAIPEGRNSEGEIEEELANNELLPEERDSKGETERRLVNKEVIPEEMSEEGMMERTVLKGELEQAMKSEISKELETMTAERERIQQSKEEPMEFEKGSRGERKKANREAIEDKIAMEGMILQGGTKEENRRGQEKLGAEIESKEEGLMKEETNQNEGKGSEGTVTANMDMEVEDFLIKKNSASVQAENGVVNKTHSADTTTIAVYQEEELTNTSSCITSQQSTLVNATASQLPPSSSFSSPSDSSPSGSSPGNYLLKRAHIILFLAATALGTLIFFSDPPISTLFHPRTSYLSPMSFMPYELTSRTIESRPNKTGQGSTIAIFTFKPLPREAWLFRAYHKLRKLSLNLLPEVDGEEEMRITVKDWQYFWKKGLWSVEIKQPSLQISRNYTPLPPVQEMAQNALPASLGGENKKATERQLIENELKFLIKLEPIGEVSRWLFDLPIGTKVYLRGPHWEYIYPSDPCTALEKESTVPGLYTPPQTSSSLSVYSQDLPKAILFLAGGTGIAPALQLASSFFYPPLPNSSTSFSKDIKSSTENDWNKEFNTNTNLHILYAVRTPTDIPPTVKNNFDVLKALAAHKTGRYNDISTSYPSFSFSEDNEESNINNRPYGLKQSSRPSSAPDIAWDNTKVGGTFEITYFVDSLATYISPSHISSSLNLPSQSQPPPFSFPVQFKNCWFSSSSIVLPTTQPHSASYSHQKNENAENKFIFISGPPGFVRYFVGHKPPETLSTFGHGRAQAQGPVAGVISDVVRREELRRTIVDGVEGVEGIEEKGDKIERKRKWGSWIIWKL